MVTVHVCGDYGLGQVFPTPVLPSPTWALVLCYPNMSVKPDVTLTSAFSRQVLPQYLLVQDLDQDCWVSTSFLVSVMGWSWYSFTRWQAPSIPALVGVTQWCCFGLFQKLFGGLGLLAPFKILGKFASSAWIMQKLKRYE